ncbi:MAG: hypothetical protein HQL50_08265 [Magnetococcales bacterium]|nr:hypothetical protein [Magnetococcales bacterium]
MSSAPTQQTVLNAFSQRKRQSLDELDQALTVRRREIVKAAGSLIKRGLLKREARGVYRLTRSGSESLKSGTALRSGPTGPRSTPTKRRQTLRQRVWRGLRWRGQQNKKSTIRDLVGVAETGKEKGAQKNAERYLRALERAGYLTKMRIREQGHALTSNGFIRYRLVVDTGREAPTVRQGRQAVFDHNINREIPFGTIWIDGEPQGVEESERSESL